MPHPITMKTFGEMGYQLEDFAIPNPDDQGRTFTYYTFSGQGRPELYDVWEVIGSPVLYVKALAYVEAMAERSAPIGATASLCSIPGSRFTESAGEPQNSKFTGIGKRKLRKWAISF